MSIAKMSAIIFSLILACAVFLPRARADQWNQMTRVTFNEPVEIPGAVLPAGTYWFVLVNNISDRDIVRIYSGDWSKLDAELQTVPAYRRQITNDTEVKFVERTPQKPPALLKWFFPGNTVGHEFIYSSRHEKEFARDAKQDVVAQQTSLAPNKAANP